MNTRFDGSYLGDAARLPADARLECGVCWWVYDPALGDLHLFDVSVSLSGQHSI